MDEKTLLRMFDVESMPAPVQLFVYRSAVECSQYDVLVRLAKRHELTEELDELLSSSTNERVLESWLWRVRRDPEIAVEKLLAARANNVCAKLIDRRPLPEALYERLSRQRALPIARALLRHQDVPLRVRQIAARRVAAHWDRGTEKEKVQASLQSMNQGLYIAMLEESGHPALVRSAAGVTDPSPRLVDAVVFAVVRELSHVDPEPTKAWAELAHDAIVATARFATLTDAQHAKLYDALICFTQGSAPWVGTMLRHTCDVVKALVPCDDTQWQQTLRLARHGDPTMVVGLLANAHVNSLQRQRELIAACVCNPALPVSALQRHAHSLLEPVLDEIVEVLLEQGRVEMLELLANRFSVERLARRCGSRVAAALLSLPKPPVALLRTHPQRLISTEEALASFGLQTLLDHGWQEAVAAALDRRLADRPAEIELFTRLVPEWDGPLGALLDAVTQLQQ